MAYASIHGNTAGAAKQMAEILKAKGVEKIKVTDLARDDMAEAVENAFRYSRMVVAASSYDAGLFPPMDAFLRKLKAKNFQSRRVAVIENGSWAPSAGKCMNELLGEMKNITVCGTVTIRSAVKPENVEAMEQLADALLEK